MPDRTRVLDQRIWSNVEKTDGCWLWTGTTTDGYGYAYLDGHTGGAHRVVYELLVGPIPDGLELDHTCHDPETCAGGITCPHRRCVNPAHLEPVSHGENVRRGVNAWREKTHCPQGHPYDEANTYRWGGRRACRICRNEASRRLRGRRAAQRRIT